MRALLLFALAVLVGGCSSPDRYELAGAASDFCIPDSQKISNVPWAPDDAPGTPKGFAFAGCEGVTGAEAGQCPFPASISGGVVEEQSAFRSQRWADFGAKSTLKLGTLSPSSAKTLSEDNSVLIVHRDNRWDVWSHTADGGQKQDAPQLADSDVLLASCLAESDPLPSDRSWPAGLKCRRAVLASDYSLEYSFRSENMSPAVLEQLDKKVMSTINQWRCGSKR